MSTASDFSVRFWGARGNIPCSGENIDRYGGDTACVEVRCGDRLLIFDAGSGLRSFGRSLMESGRSSADVSLSHTHLDHIIGFPFFKPAYERENSFRVWVGHLLPADDVKSVLCRLMRAPLRTAPLNHPNRATGYRIDFGGKSVCYITDTEHRTGERDETILDLIAGANVVIYNAQYSDEEYPYFRGFGH